MTTEQQMSLFPGMSVVEGMAIVERLFKICEEDPFGDKLCANDQGAILAAAHALCQMLSEDHPAADEIERLRALLDEVKAELLQAYERQWASEADEIDKLRAQVVALQSSLDAAPEHTRLGKKKTPDALEKP